MSLSAESEREVCADMLARGLDDVVRELRTIDPVDLVSFIRFGSYPAIEDLLQSSAELFFKEGTLTFGWTAGVDLEWNEFPRVTLGLEFRHQAVAAFFDLMLSAANQSVHVSCILHDPECASAMERITRLAEALADATLPRRLSASADAPGRKASDL